MTIDEAIKHCLEVVEKNEQAKKDGNLWIDTEYEDCCADPRQLAEWLMDYKDLKAEQNDQYVFIHELMSELKEAKRLLKAAKDDCYKWRYADEALKLIGGTDND